MNKMEISIVNLNIWAGISTRSTLGNTRTHIHSDLNIMF